MHNSTIRGQIQFLLHDLNDANTDSIILELSQLLDLGIDGNIQLLKVCLDYMVFHKEANNVLLGIVLSSMFKIVLGKPNFTTLFCECLDDVEVREDFIEKLCDELHLSISEKIAVGLSLSDSLNPETRMCAKKFCISQIENLCANPVNIDSSKLIQDIVMFLYHSDGLSKYLEQFVQLLSLIQPRDAAPFALTPLFSGEMREENFLRNVELDNHGEDEFDDLLAEMEKEMSLGDIVKELGYGCTADASYFQEILSLFTPLTENTVSKLLGTITRHHVGLDDNQSIVPTYGLALGFTTAADISPLSSWDVGNLVDAIKRLAPDIDWIEVMEKLDYEGFYIPNEDAFSFLMSLFRHACQGPFPVHAICGSVWKNAEGQLSIIKYAVLASPDVFTFAHSGRQLVYSDIVDSTHLQAGLGNQAWFCHDLLNVLCHLAERGYLSSVRSILEYPLKHCPEILLFGIANTSTAYNLLQLEVCFSVFRLIMKSTVDENVIQYLWRMNPGLVVRGFVDFHSNEPESLSKIFDICHNLKILSTIVDVAPLCFAIRLAAIANGKNLMDFEKWLANNLMTHKDQCFEECLKFLREYHQSGAQDFPSKSFRDTSTSWNFHVEISSSVLKVLKAHSESIKSTQLLEEIERFQLSSGGSNARLENGGSFDSSAPEGYPEDVEAEANSYFHQMFSGHLKIEAVVEMLATFKESSVKREKSIFDCMIGNLFEEYRFLSKYPERQLKIAALLFGSVIKHQLVTHLTLGIALRWVLDALRKPPDSKMFVFGTKALEQFVDRLIEWPQYCNHILQISHLRNTNAELVAFIERALARISSGHVESDGGSSSTNVGLSLPTTGSGELPSTSMSQPMYTVTAALQGQQRSENPLDDRPKIPSLPSDKLPPLPLGQSGASPSVDSGTPQKPLSIGGLSAVSSSPGFGASTVQSRSSRAATSARFGSALNIETLVAAAERRATPIVAPGSEVQDKISFIINNISAANMETKSKELIEILKDDCYPWFAQYMVMKRASIEPNFHDLYLKFLDKVGSKALNKEIVQATYENCKVLLGSDLIKSSSEERSLLKNLGSWLGKLTIGRNQVLRAREIDPKSLIIEAYEKGLMIAVIPFTSKILEPCQSSLAYQPPNPWTMGILGLLAEIYSMPNLKMNLKFDIEVLFKNLGVDLKDIPPTSLLKDRRRDVEGNPDFSNKDNMVPQQQMVTEVKSGLIPPISHVEIPLEVTSPPNSVAHTHLLSQFPTPVHLPSGPLLEDEKLAALGISDQLPSAQGLFPATQSQSPFNVSQLPPTIPNIGTHVVINQKITALGLHLHFQRAVPIAIDRAIKEIVSNIVQRSVSIATQTTKELVLKDYAMESDETRVYNAAHLMVASLAGSLAHVTCKEPLRSAMSNNLRSLLPVSVAAEPVEHAIQLATNDNLDLGCAIIEQAATDKAIQTIDGEISQQLLRRKHRDSSAFFDPNIYSQGSINVVPEALRPKPGHLSISQQRVYEDFVRLPWQNQLSQGSQAVPMVSSGVSAASGLVYGTTPEQLNTSYSSNSGSINVETSSRTFELAAEALDSNPASNLSATAIHMSPVDVVQQNAENVSTAQPSAGPDHTVDITSTKESAVAAQALQVVTERTLSNICEPSLNTRDALDKYQILARKLDSLVNGDAKEAEIQGVINEVPEIILRCISRDEAALAVAQKVFKGLYENASNNSYLNASLAILVAIRDICKLVVKELTSWVIYSDDDRKYNKDVSLGLIRSDLLNLGEYNVHMAKLIDGGRNKAATDFSISLIQALVVEESNVISELHNLVDSLAKLAMKPGSPESLLMLVEIARNPGANVAALSGAIIGKEDKPKYSRDKKGIYQPISVKESNIEFVEPADPAGFREQVSLLFFDWYRINDHPGVNDAASTHYVLQLHQNGLLKNDEMTDRFFRLLTELSVAHCLTSEAINSSTLQASQHPQNLSFLAIDVYTKLIHSILKVEQGPNRVSLFAKILAVTVRFLLRDSEEKKATFNPRPYFRLFINWFFDLASADFVNDGVSFQMLTAFANAFHNLQPLKVPAFSFAWLELVGHRSFMPKLLTGNSQMGWPYVQRLLVDLFQFLEPFLRNAELGMPVHFLYKGTLRVLLVLLHDFPEFLCDYHFTFCDLIPPSCIQMRNIILSAFPRNMRLPDPSTPNLKIDLLPEIREPPRILSEVDATLKTKHMKADIDEYLKTRPQNSPFLAELKQKLLLSANEAASVGTRYNVPLINSLVLYSGMQAIQMLPGKSPHAQSMGSSAPLALFVDAALDIYHTLVLELDTEGRYLFLNAVANQLRYPNNHTHYFSFVLLYLFAESNQEIIQEQITRVLLERLIVNRPHPWGLLITFIELIKNPRYNFWNRSFIRCAPEIEKLFESVARSCGGLKPIDDGIVSGWVSEGTH